MMTILNTDDRDTLQRRVRNLTLELAPVTGKLTASRMLCHIADQLAVALGDIPCKPQSTFLTETLAKWFVLYAPVRIPFGKVNTVSEMLSTEPSSWASDVARFELLLSRFVDAERVAPHSVFGKLSHKQWGFLAAKHIDHHLRQFGV